MEEPLRLKKTWCYLAHKDGHWAGVSAPDLKGIGSWIAGYIKDGFTVSSLGSREEYLEAINAMKSWHEHPDYKTKKQRTLSASKPQRRLSGSHDRLHRRPTDPLFRF